MNAHRVKYLVVGVYAGSIHAQPRATKDIDILVKADAENALQGMAVADFSQPGPSFRMGREPVGVDILTEIPGVEFDGAWQRRVEAVVDPSSELSVNFISREDLIAAKRASGRPQDLADIDAIENSFRANRPNPHN